MGIKEVAMYTCDRCGKTEMVDPKQCSWVGARKWSTFHVSGIDGAHSNAFDINKVLCSVCFEELRTAYKTFMREEW